MTTVLNGRFVNIEGINYNFDYAMLPETGQRGTETSYTFYRAVTDHDPEKPRPIEWIRVKMAENNYVTYRPVRPFDLTVDPVAQFVVFTDFESADKRRKFKHLRTLREKNPGSWPADPTQRETLIATQPNLEVINNTFGERGTIDRTITETGSEQEKNEVEPDKTKLEPDKTNARPDERKSPESKTDMDTKRNTNAEAAREHYRQRSSRRYHSQTGGQQHLQQMEPHRTFGLPSPDLATLLPYPGTSQHREHANKRHSLDRSLEWPTASPDGTPERTRKVPDRPWMQPRYLTDYDGAHNY